MPVSIIIPIYNEADYLVTQINRLTRFLNSRMGLTYEIILIENGSHDETYEVASSYAKSHSYIHVLSLKLPSYGQAIKQGILLARYHSIVQFDIDFIDTGFFIDALRLLSQADIVVGSKLHPQAFDKRPFLRIFITRVVHFIIRKYLGYRGTDTHGIKAYKRSVVRNLLPRVMSIHHFFDTEMLLFAQRLGYSILEIPVHSSELRATRFPFRIRFFQAIRELFLLCQRKELFINRPQISFHADDCGNSLSGDRVIGQLVKNNILNSTSVLVNGDHIMHFSARRFLKNIRIHLHVNLVEGIPVSLPKSIPTLVNRHGRFFSFPLFVMRMFLGLIDVKDVRREIESQIHRLKKLGLSLGGIDSHQHIHALSPISEIVDHIARLNAVPYKRKYSQVLAITFRAKVMFTLLKVVAVSSYFISYRKFGFPSSWGGPKDGRNLMFMSWEAFLPIREIRHLSTITLIVHPGLGIDRDEESLYDFR